MKKIIFVSRCAWTLYNFRKDIMLEFLKRGYKVYALGGPEGDYGEKLKKLGIEYISIPIEKKGMNPVRDLKVLLSLIALYKKINPNVVFHYTIKPIIYGSLAAGFLQFKNIYNFITGLGYVFIGKKGVLRELVKFLYNISLSFSEKVFFYNDEDYLYFFKSEIILPLKSFFIPGSGVDKEVFVPDQKKKKANVKIAMVSRFLVEKGVREFVKIACEIKSITDRVDFVMIGGIDPRNPSTVTEEEVKEWISKGIIVKGKIDDIPSFLRGIDFLVHPTYYKEGIPRILLEVGATGLPVITSSIPGCRDVVVDGETGFLVVPRDNDILKKKVLFLIFSPSFRKKMGKKGREKVVRRFSNEVVFRKIFSFIEKDYPKHKS